MKTSRITIYIFGFILVVCIIIYAIYRLCLMWIFDLDETILTYKNKDGKELTWIDRKGILDAQERSTIKLDSCGHSDTIEIYYNIHSMTLGDTLIVNLDSLAYVCSPMAVDKLKCHGIGVVVTKEYTRHNRSLRYIVEDAKSGGEWPSEESKEFYRKRFPR